jgi:hypothetical protein
MMKTLFRATIMGFLGAKEAALASKVMNAVAALLVARIMFTVFAAFLPLVVLTAAVGPSARTSAGRPGEMAA